MSARNAITLNINIKAAENMVEESVLQGLEVCGIQIENYGRTNLTINGSVDTGLLRNSLAHAVSGEVPSIGKNYKGTSRRARTYHANATRKDGRPVEMVESVDKKGKKKQELPKGTYTGHTPKKKGDLRVYVGTNVYYAPYVEMGHRQNVGQFVAKLGRRLVAPFVKAKPFLRPAFTEHIQEYRDILGMYIAQGAEDFNNK